jgi:hypothetical protein
VNSLPPDIQMEAFGGGSTEMALELLIEQVFKAWVRVQE